MMLKSRIKKLEQSVFGETETKRIFEIRSMMRSLVSDDTTQTAAIEILKEYENVERPILLLGKLPKSIAGKEWQRRKERYAEIMANPEQYVEDLVIHLMKECDLSREEAEEQAKVAFSKLEV